MLIIIIILNYIIKFLSMYITTNSQLKQVDVV